MVKEGHQIRAVARVDTDLTSEQAAATDSRVDLLDDRPRKRRAVVRSFERVQYFVPDAPDIAPRLEIAGRIASIKACKEAVGNGSGAQPPVRQEEEIAVDFP